MLKKNVSGQFIFIDAVSVLSGFMITGFSGQISGTRWTDTGVRTVLSGNIVEVSGGVYRANLYDWDTSGDYMGYLFTASGMVPRMFSIITDGAVSGRTFPASGVNVVVPPATLSGVVANSGLFASVPKATLSGMVANSGLFVTVPIATISGTNAVVPIASISGTTVASVSVLSGQLSGQQVTARTVTDKTGYSIASGQLSGHVIDLLSGRSYTASGIHAVATATVASGDVFLASGHAVFVYSGQLSGHVIDLLSGRSYTASGVHAVATATVQSGEVYLASGHGFFVSGQLYLASGSLSGQQVDLVSGRSYIASGINVVGSFSLASGALSGQQVTLVSGQSYIASGHNTVVPPATLSGVNATVPIASISGTTVASVSVLSGQLSGQQVTARTVTDKTGYSVDTVNDKSGYTVGTNLDKSGYTAGLISGVNYFASGQHVVVPPATLSGVVANSGLFVSVPIATISGVQAVATATVASGDVFLASGHFLFGSGQYRLASGHQVVAAVVSDKSGYTVGTSLDKSGYTLSASGLDTITVETGLNFRQAQTVMAAVLGGRLSGAGTSTIRFDGMNRSGTNRVDATVDASGNRTAVNLSLPT